MDSTTANDQLCASQPSNDSPAVGNV